MTHKVQLYYQKYRYPNRQVKGLVSACSENMLDLYRKFLWYRLIFIELKLAKSYKSSITIDLYSLDKF